MKYNNNRKNAYSVHVLVGFALFLLVAIPDTSAQLDIPSDGSDGVLTITEDTEIDLSLAVTGAWSDNNSANAGKGIYDPEKWAVVFKYDAVNIIATRDGEGTITDAPTVTFRNHPSRAPVVWLVNGDVLFEGALWLAPGYPGGYRGISGGAWGPWVGNSLLKSSVFPLRGAASGSSSPGGGAILIAASGELAFTSLGYNSYNIYAGGSRDGAIRLIANSITGSGRCYAASWDVGRIRVETTSLSPSIEFVPDTAPTSPSDPPIIWPPDTAPKVEIKSVSAIPVPAEPLAPLEPETGDVILDLPLTEHVEIVVETRDFAIDGKVWVRKQPVGLSGSSLLATYVEGDALRATWSVTTTFATPRTALIATASPNQ